MTINKTAHNKTPLLYLLEYCMFYSLSVYFNFTSTLLRIVTLVYWHVQMEESERMGENGSYSLADRMTSKNIFFLCFHIHSLFYQFLKISNAYFFKAMNALYSE